MEYVYLRSTKMIVSFIIGTILLIPLNSLSCSIPVFRYALEYWKSDPYRLEILYSKALSHAENELVDYLQKASSHDSLKSNIKIMTVDIESDDHGIPQNILKNLSSKSFPLMVLRYPFVSGINVALWSAPLNINNINLLLHSPVRDSIANKLTTNATAVWIFLESDDNRKNREALDLLNKELKRLEQTLTFPDAEMWLNNHQAGSGDDVPLVKFDVISVSRNDPQEEYLVNMLLNSEDHLNEIIVSEPIIFPIYGRGIIMGAITTKGINEGNIRYAAEFLTGPCSCQAKMLNPGIDLLMSLNWDKQIENITDISISNPLTGLGDFTRKEEEVSRLLESATNEAFAAKSRRNNKSQESLRSEEMNSYQYDDFLKTDSTQLVILEFQKKRSFNSLAIIITGSILVIILVGIVVYLKHQSSRK